METEWVRRWLVLLVVALLVFTAHAARASPSAKLVYIRTQGAESCPGEAELRRAVAIRIGYDPFFPVARKTVVAQVQRAPKGFQGKAQIVGDDGNLRGERELSTTGDDCGELVGALALAVSIALDDLDEDPPAPENAKAEFEPEAEPASRPEPVASPPPADAPRPAAPRPSPAPAAPIEGALSIGPLVSVGTGPNAAAGASLALAARWRWFGVRLDLRGDLASSKPVGGGRLATNAALASVAACVRGAVPFVCAGPGAGILFSETSNITRPASDRASLVIGVVRGGADVAFGKRLYLEPFAEVGVNLVARSIAVDGWGVHEISPFWGAIGIHLGGRIF